MFLRFSGPSLINVPEDTSEGKLLDYFIVRNNRDLYRGVSCHLRQIAPPQKSSKPVFLVKTELTPLVGETRCSIFLHSSLDYEKVSSYIVQIVAEVKVFMVH